MMIGLDREVSLNRKLMKINLSIKDKLMLRMNLKIN